MGLFGKKKPALCEASVESIGEALSTQGLDCSQLSTGGLLTQFNGGPGPRKVDTSGVSYAAWVSVADVSASKVSGARRLHQECRLRVL